MLGSLFPATWTLGCTQLELQSLPWQTVPCVPAQDLFSFMFIDFVTR